MRYSGFLSLATRLFFVSQNPFRDKKALVYVTDTLDEHSEILTLAPLFLPNRRIESSETILETTSISQHLTILCAGDTPSFTIITQKQLNELQLPKSWTPVAKKVQIGDRKAMILKMLLDCGYQQCGDVTELDRQTFCFPQPASLCVRTYMDEEFLFDFFGDTLDTIFIKKCSDTAPLTQTQNITILAVAIEDLHLPFSFARIQNTDIHIIAGADNLPAHSFLAGLPRDNDTARKHFTGIGHISDTKQLSELLSAAPNAQCTLYTTHKKEIEQTLDPQTLQRINIQEKAEWRRKAFGFFAHDENHIILTDHDLVFLKKTVNAPREHHFLQEMHPWNYVIHIHHGVGLFQRMETRDFGGVKTEYYVIEYAGKDSLLVPVTQTDRLSLYHTNNGKPPKLTNLAGKSWEEVIEKTKTEIRMIAGALLKTAAEREKTQWPVCDTKNHTEMIRFLDDFPYVETPDQNACFEDIARDMASGMPMDRLVCGDVWFGKTEMALRAAMLACLAGKQVLFIAPTMLLAGQHYKSFVERFAWFGFHIALFSRESSIEDKKQFLKSFAKGDIHIAVGTHRLLSDQIQAQALWIVIFDEEQRFGVEQKEVWKQRLPGIHMLSLSATPIPRTLHLSLSGVRNVSLLTTPPPGRQAIETFVRPFDEEIVLQTIKNERDRGGQVFLLYNRVQGLELFAAHIHKLYTQKYDVPFSYSCVHGKIPGHILEERITAFALEQTQVLFASTIIENGIDIPNANTIIVCNAHKFGLSQMHQIRGRVGRRQTRGKAFFLYPWDIRLTEEAEKRLAAIETFQKLGDGFALSSSDMDIRGIGNILWSEQHGSIETVGVSHYFALIREEMQRQKRGLVEGVAFTTLDVGLSGTLPDSDILNVEQKIELYRSFATAKNVEELQGLYNRLEQIFGTVPLCTYDLFWTSHLRFWCQKYGVQSMHVRKNDRLGWVLQLSFHIEKNTIETLFAAYPHVQWTLTSQGAQAHLSDFGGVALWVKNLLNRSHFL